MDDAYLTGGMPVGLGGRRGRISVMARAKVPGRVQAVYAARKGDDTPKVTL
jgi:hypothetical protein